MFELFHGVQVWPHFLSFSSHLVNISSRRSFLSHLSSSYGVLSSRSDEAEALFCGLAKSSSFFLRQSIVLPSYISVCSYVSGFFCFACIHACANRVETVSNRSRASRSFELFNIFNPVYSVFVILLCAVYSFITEYCSSL